MDYMQGCIETIAGYNGVKFMITLNHEGSNCNMIIDLNNYADEDNMG